MPLIELIKWKNIHTIFLNEPKKGDFTMAESIAEHPLLWMALAVLKINYDLFEL